MSDSHAQDGVEGAQIRRRQVYYVHGFDPRGARLYHRLYRNEARLQDAVNGTTLSVGKAQPSGDFAMTWKVDAQWKGHSIQTRYTFLRWEDLVWGHWCMPWFRILALCALFYVRYFRSGAMRQLWQCSKRYTASTLVPLAFAFLSLVVTIAISGLAARLVPDRFWEWGSAVPWATAGVAAVVVGTLAILWAERLRVLWLARICIFMDRWGGGHDADVQARWRAFAQHIADDEDARGADEVLLVGHSVGAWAVVCVLNELLAMPNGQAMRARLRIVTLGQSIPMLSFCPGASAFREQVRYMAACGVPWLDFTAPSDPLCTALAHPLTGALAKERLPAVPVVRSARFDRMFSPERFRRLASDPFRIHFQYLMASEHPVENDYFSLTAGPHPLAKWMERRP